jgi:hypothetical protein
MYSQCITNLILDLALQAMSDGRWQLGISETMEPVLNHGMSAKNA